MSFVHVTRSTAKERGRQEGEEQWLLEDAVAGEEEEEGGGEVTRGGVRVLRHPQWRKEGVSCHVCAMSVSWSAAILVQPSLHSPFTSKLFSLQKLKSWGHANWILEARRYSLTSGLMTRASSFASLR